MLTQSTSTTTDHVPDACRVWDTGGGPDAGTLSPPVVRHGTDDRYRCTGRDPESRNVCLADPCGRGAAALHSPTWLSSSVVTRRASDIGSGLRDQTRGATLVFFERAGGATSGLISCHDGATGAPHAPSLHGQRALCGELSSPPVATGHQVRYRNGIT